MPTPATVEPRISLLYVDDEPALLEIARLFLESIGNYSVSTCDSPHDALKIISEDSFDAIISDYQMPDCDGISFLKYLRKIGNKTPFIIFTGRGREDVVIQALNEGADFYLQKGGDPKSQFAELSNKVRYAVTRKQAEEELEHEKAIMDAIFSSVPGMLYLYDSEGKLIRWNANHLLMTGYSPEELAGMQLLDWYKGDEESQAAVLEGISRTMKEGFGEAEANLQKKDGTTIPMYFTASPVTIHGRQYFTGIGIDISDKKAAESALLRNNEELSAAEEELRSQLDEIITIRDQLEESNEYLGNLITYANAPIIVWDQQCRITRFNDAFGRLTGIPPDEAIGKNLSILFPDDSRDISMDLIRRAMAGETWDVVEIPIRHRSGEVRTVLWNSANIRGNDGERIIATIAQGQDITDRKKAEMELLKKNEELRAAEEKMQAAYEELTATEEEIRSQLDENIAIQHQLALSEEQYRAIFEYTEAPTVIIEEDTTISLANSAFAAISGYSSEEVIGRSWTEFIIKHDLDRMMAYHQQRREKEAEPPTQYDFTFINRYGDPRTIHLTIGMIPGTRQSVASFHDITELKQVEEALRESEEKYRLIADNTADNIWIFDMDFNLRYISPSVLTMKGFTVEESFAQTVEEKLTPASYAALLDRFNEEMDCEATGTADPDRNVSFETEEYCKDGSTIKVENSTRLLRDDEGRPVGILGISRDITDRKAAEEALRESEDRLNHAITGTGAGLWDWDMINGRVFFSRQWKSMLGYDDHEIENTFSGWKILWHPDDAARIEKAVNDYLEGRTKSYEIEHRLRHKDGSWHWILTRGDIQRDAEGRPIRWVGTNIDITEQKKQAEELENFFRVNLDLLCIADLEENFIKTNETWSTILGYSTEELNKRKFLEFVHPDDIQATLDAMADLGRGNDVLNFTNRYRCKDGSYRYIEWRSHPHGNLIYAAARDITERINAKEALHTANKKLHLLSSITRHDIMNKIMALHAYIDLTLPEIDDPTLSGYLKGAEEAATAIQKQIEFTKAYEDLGVQTPTWQPLAAIIEAIDDSRLPIHHDCGEVSVYADPMFESVLHNLYDNTLRYAEGADCVRIRCEEKESDLIIIWEDNGPGIPDDQKERIFDKGVGKNTGLGLFLTREILSITGITISETGVYGEGARFEIRVPAGGFLGT